MGNTREAEKILNQLKDQATKRRGFAVPIAIVYATLGDKDQAFAWLDKAYEQQAEGLLVLRVAPPWDPLRSDPRFVALEKKVYGNQ